MDHAHSVYDTDNHYVIDPIGKSISTKSAKNILIQGDHNSERFTFEVPRSIEGHDMTECNLIEIHYDNISKDKKDISSDFYTVRDMQISPDDDSVAIFSWLISRAATKYVGKLTFSITFKCTNEDDEEVYAWSTGDYTGVKINSRRHNTEKLLEEHSDFVARMETLAEDALECIADYDEGIKQIAETVETADKYIGEYEVKELVLESTPEMFKTITQAFETSTVTMSWYEDEGYNNGGFWIYESEGWLNSEATYQVRINNGETIDVPPGADDVTYGNGDIVFAPDYIGIFNDTSYTEPPKLYIVAVESHPEYVRLPKEVFGWLVEDDAQFVLDVTIGIDVGIPYTFNVTLSSDLFGSSVINMPLLESLHPEMDIENSDVPIVKTYDNAYDYAVDTWFRFVITNDWKSAGPWVVPPPYELPYVYIVVPTILEIPQIGTSCSFKLYKITKSLGSRIAQIVDDINGEVV